MSADDPRFDGAAFSADMERAGLSPRDVARGIDVSERIVHLWCAGGVASPSYPKLMLARDMMNASLPSDQPRADERSWWTYPAEGVAS